MNPSTPNESPRLDPHGHPWQPVPRVWEVIFSWLFFPVVFAALSLWLAKGVAQELWWWLKDPGNR